MKTTLDFETTFQPSPNGGNDPTPFHEDNYLVSAGFKILDTQEEGYLYFKHNDIDPIEQHYIAKESRIKLQEVLDKTTLLIAHNAKFELIWLWAAGFKYTGKVWCTQVAEYVHLRGIKQSLTLKDILRRHRLSNKRTDLTEEYLDQGIGFEAMPIDIVTEYGIGDIDTTVELYEYQQKRIHEEEPGLLPVTEMSMDFCIALAKMTRNGIHIDQQALQDVKIDYENEKEQLLADIAEMMPQIVGDTPINIASPLQLSQVIYSRIITNRTQWANVFNIGAELRNGVSKPKYRPRMGKQKFADAVRGNTTILQKTELTVCTVCDGLGEKYKVKKNGELWKNPTKCKNCDGEGVVYLNTGVVGGLKLSPSSIQDVSANGFKTGSETLEALAARAKHPLAKAFLTKIVRLNAVSSYLSTFVEGISRNIRPNGLLHTNLNQCITATGRLSSSGPNFQNLPRGGNFPVRRCLISRWKGGTILKADFSQLEFRVAVALARDHQGIADILAGVDVHKLTKDVIGCSRNDAKPHTFKPLYGGTFGSPSEMAYYSAFLLKYKDIANWHIDLQEEAIGTLKVVSPSGREYSYPYCTRQANGSASGATQIKNYIVQGFATGDLVPIAVIEVQRLLEERGLKSLAILTVHDEVDLDCYPGEEKEAAQALIDGMMCVASKALELFGFEFPVPLGIEVEQGLNMMEKETIHVI